MKQLIILRGVSGAGKSTVAETIAGKAWPVFEADKYHYRDGVYDWKPENMAVAHKWCQEQVREAMECRIAKIIVSNTSTTEKELKPYIALADEHGYQVISLVVEHRHGGENIHGVPEHVLDRQERKLRGSIKLR